MREMVYQGWNRWRLTNGQLKGVCFMWSNFQEPPSHSRLDHFLHYQNWGEYFSRMQQFALTRFTSDHIPILLEPFQPVRGPVPFKFEEMWFLADDFMEFVELEWGMLHFEGSPSRVLALKLKSLKVNLKEWSKSRFGVFNEFKEEYLCKIKLLGDLEKV